MRIAIIETAPRGGLLHYTAMLADALAERGHAVDVLATRGNELSGHAGPARIRGTLVTSEVGAWTGGSQVARVRRRARIALRLGTAWAQIAWLVRPGRYDAVIVDNDLSVEVTAAGALALTYLPRRALTAAVCHNVRPFNRWSGDDLYATSKVLLGLLGRVYRRMDLVFVHGEKSRDEFVATWGARRLTQIPHGDERIFGDPPPPADEERILFFGDWRKVKGLGVLQEAFDLLAARRPSVRLTIAGSPGTEGDVAGVSAWAAGHDGRVEIDARYIPNEEVGAIFGRARVVAVPYLVGYQSGVAHTAMTLGRAVVASDVGDIASAVRDGQTGRIVAPGDAAALADALEGVLADPALAAALGAEGHRRITSGASWEAVAERVEQALLDAA